MSRRPRILVVDDEIQLLSLISYVLSRERYDVVTAATANEALEQVAAQPIDLIVLDVVLPDGNGLDLCRKLQRHTDAPVVFLTVMSDQAEIIAGFEAGGDDYLAKPFSVEELLLRINAVLRRSARQENEMRLGTLTLHLDSYEAEHDGHNLELTPLEFRFLRYLGMNRARIVSTAELVEQVWGVADLGAHDPIVKTAVYRIRQKLDSAARPSIEIRNVRGIGYQIRVITEVA